MAELVDTLYQVLILTGLGISVVIFSWLLIKGNTRG